MTRAFITGITGQTGSYLCEQLLAEGWQVHGLVSSPDGLESALTERAPSVALHRGDLANPDELRRIVVEVAPDVVFNLGGISSVAQSWQQPHRTGEVTGLSVATLLAAVKTLGESGHETRFVQASSAEIFGAAPPPQNESTPVRPLNPYGAAKAYAHHQPVLEYQPIYRAPK